jgi:hypothetical protein
MTSSFDVEEYLRKGMLPEDRIIDIINVEKGKNTLSRSCARMRPEFMTIISNS